MTARTTRADRMAQPTARDAVRAVAENHGACLRPIQLRRTNTESGETDQVLIPCGSTLASICPPCAERAKNLRAAQCREGWHLDTNRSRPRLPRMRCRRCGSSTVPRPKPTATTPPRPGRTRPSWMS